MQAVLRRRAARRPEGPRSGRRAGALSARPRRGEPNSPRSKRELDGSSRSPGPKARRTPRPCAAPVNARPERRAVRAGPGREAPAVHRSWQTNDAEPCLDELEVFDVPKVVRATSRWRRPGRQVDVVGRIPELARSTARAPQRRPATATAEAGSRTSAARAGCELEFAAASHDRPRRLGPRPRGEVRRPAGDRVPHRGRHGRGGPGRSSPRRRTGRAAAEAVGPAAVPGTERPERAALRGRR